MKRALIAMAFAVAMTTPAVAWEVKDMNEVINQTNFIVGMNGRGFCSGTLVSKEYRLVLTNYHCVASAVTQRTKEVVKDGVVSKVQVEDLKDMEVSQKAYDQYRLVGNSTWKATIVARWQESDLALLQIRSKDIPQAKASPVFAGDTVYRGETVYAVGNPAMMDATVTKGVVSSTNRMFFASWAGAEVPFMQMDAGIVGGSSGGALYNDKGELIGVPAAALPGTAIALAIPFFRIQEFLTNNCYGKVWDVLAVDHDTCVADKEAKAKEE